MTSCPHHGVPHDDRKDNDEAQEDGAHHQHQAHVAYEDLRAQNDKLLGKGIVVSH